MTPFLDVSDIVVDPDFADTFSIIRRQEVVNTFGESVLTTAELDNLVGVVTQASPNDLQRMPEWTGATQVISLVTKVRLYGPMENSSLRYQPDLILWDGDTYVVKVLEPYTRFGQGQVQALCEQFKYVQQVPQS